VKRALGTFLFLISLSLTPTLAHADLLWDLRAGVKGVVTGALWTAPDEAPGDVSYFWGDTQAYVGGGGGAYIEIVFLKFVGLELDVLYEKNALSFDQTINGFAYTYATNFDQLRVPLLLKGTLPLGLVELSLGVGPEFVFGQSADVDVSFRTKGADNALKEVYKAEAADGTFLTGDLGLNVKLWKLVIPISLRVGKNLSQSSSYDERVGFEWSGTPYASVVNTATVKAIESWHFALMAGLGYVF
jgi:hypothetical protein